MISVIIPLYNKQKELPKTLESLLSQSYKDLEVIIVNDGSTDGSQELAASFSARFLDNNIGFKILSFANQGAPAARNRGFGNSQGKYLLFCDADVVLDKDALETMLNILKSKKEAAYVYSSFIWGRKLFKSFPFSAERLKKMPYIHSTALIRREKFPVGGWDEKIARLQDWDLYLTMLANGCFGYWINRPLFTVQVGGVMSSWLPAFAYKLCPFLPEVRKYKKAVSIIKAKHQLD